MEKIPEFSVMVAFLVAVAIAATASLVMQYHDTVQKRRKLRLALLFASFLHGGSVGLFATLCWYGFGSVNVYWLWAASLALGWFPYEAKQLVFIFGKRMIRGFLSELLTGIGSNGDGSTKKDGADDDSGDSAGGRNRADKDKDTPGASCSPVRCHIGCRGNWPGFIHRLGCGTVRRRAARSGHSH